MDYGIIGSIFTVFIFVTFIGIVLWAYSNKSKDKFEEAANLVFDDEPSNQAVNKKQESSGNE